MKPDQYTTPSPSPQKIFDVVNPGQSAPSASSKPIILYNQPSRPDPMMSQPKPATAASAPVSATPTVAMTVSTPAQSGGVALPTKVKSAHHRLRLMFPLIIGIIVLFVLADLLVDANIIHTSVVPLTNFFHHH